MTGVLAIGAVLMLMGLTGLKVWGNVDLSESEYQSYSKEARELGGWVAVIFLPLGLLFVLIVGVAT